MTYVLIMSTFFNIYIETTVAEFNSEQTCRYAGAQQEVALRNDFKLNTSKHYTFICAPKGQQ